MAEQGEEKDKQDDGAKHEPGKREEEGNKPRSKWPLIIAGIAVVVLVIAGLIYWLVTRGEVTTEDAYTDGRSISIATNTSGYVTALYVDDNTFVHKGDLLMIVDPRTNDSQLAQAKSNLLLAQANLASAQTNLQIEEVRAPAQLTQAQAQLEQAQAQLANARRNYNRQVSVNQRATAATDIDQATEQLRTASAQVKQAEANLAVATLVQQNIETAVQQVAQREAQLAQAQANLKSAEVALSYNYIRAPQDGWITMRNVDLGTYLQSGAQVFYIVVPQTWIVANFKETQLNGMRVGQKVTISVDAFPALKLRGHVQSLQQGSGAVFSAFPAENATGNFVKIVRRVPVKIVIDSGLPASLPMLPLGISVEPTVHER